MGKLFAIIRGCAIRIAAAVIFTIIWLKYTDGSVPIGNCLVLCGAINATGAWFSYLRVDGVKLVGSNTTYKANDHANRFMALLTRKGFKPSAPHEKDSQAWADPFHNKQDPKDQPFIQAGAINGLISAVLLIGSSFFV